MKKLFLPLVLLVTSVAYAEESVSTTEQFKSALFQQLPRLSDHYITLTNEQKVRFDELCGQLAHLNEQAVELLAPAYSNVLSQFVELGVSDLFMTLSFGAQPQAPTSNS